MPTALSILKPHELFSIFSQEPPARLGHVAVSYSGKVYVWGGCIKPMSTNVNTIRNDVYIFDHQSKKWTKQAIKSGSPSRCFCCAYANADADANDKSQLVYIFGGRGITNKDRSNALCCLDLENMTWTECINTGDTPGCKSGAGMVVWNGQLVLFGGYGYPRENPSRLEWTNDLHFYDLSKGEHCKVMKYVCVYRCATQYSVVSVLIFVACIAQHMLVVNAFV